MTIGTIEDEILFYISLKNPTRIENSSALVEYVFNGNEIKHSKKTYSDSKRIKQLYYLSPYRVKKSKGSFF